MTLSDVVAVLTNQWSKTKAHLFSIIYNKRAIANYPTGQAINRKLRDFVSEREKRQGDYLFIKCYIYPAVGRQVPENECRTNTV